MLGTSDVRCILSYGGDFTSCSLQLEPGSSTLFHRPGHSLIAPISVCESCGSSLSSWANYQDGWGNNETRDVADEEGSAFQVELSFGARTLGPSTMGAPEYIGDGAYRVSYVATKVS